VDLARDGGKWAENLPGPDVSRLHFESLERDA
jgi:hypothetical protein